MKKIKQYFPGILLVLYIIEFTYFALNPFNRAVWWAENLPGLITIFLLVSTFRKFRFSNLSYALMTFSLMFYTIGGHFTFERVPFDFFNNLLVNLNLEFLFPEGRNNFDRVGHFFAGIFAFPMAEVFYRKRLLKSISVAIFFGIVALGFLGAVYEIVEMFFAILASNVSGQAFISSQNDIWDAQKDMLLNITGATVVSICFGRMLKSNFKK